MACPAARGSGVRARAEAGEHAQQHTDHDHNLTLDTAAQDLNLMRDQVLHDIWSFISASGSSLLSLSLQVQGSQPLDP